MKALYLTTARAKEINACLALKAVGVPTTPGAALPTPDPSLAYNQRNGQLDVFLHVHDRCRSTFLLHARHLYNTALRVSASLCVDVIPVLAPPPAQPQESADATEAERIEVLFRAASQPPASGALQHFTSAAMRAEATAPGAGFYPLYNHVAVGGTFDHLHSGHKLLLTTAMLHTTGKLRVGMAADALLQKKKFATELQPVEERKQHVELFLQKIRTDVELDVVAIVDVSGGTDTIAEMEALVVSPETEKSLPLINERRAANGGLRPLEGIRIPYVETEEGHVVSSTELRGQLQHDGNANRTGHS